MKNVLFVAVHPDDETLGCGGSILKHKQNGDRIFWLILTMPTKNHPSAYTDSEILKREVLIKEVGKKYGFDKTINLGFPTQLLDEINFSEIVKSIDKVISDVKPEIIYIVNRSDVHSDHRISFDALYSCTKNFRKPFIEKILMYETLSETEFAPALRENAFVPNVFSDVSPFIDKKLEIMAMFDTEIMPDNLPRSLNAIRALAAFRGSRIGVSYAESFMLLFEKQ